MGPDETDPVVADLADRVGSRVEAAVPLATLTTLRVGGPCRALVTAESESDLAAVAEVEERHGVPVLVVGRGSNLLVGDDGWPGVLVRLGGGFRSVEVHGGTEGCSEGGTVVAGAAEPLPALAAAVARAGLTGFAWATAVPGTLGGAVRMNAGAHGGDMSEVLVEVEVYRRSRRALEVWPVAALGLSYRHSNLPDDAIVVGATLALEAGDEATVAAEMREIRAWRRTHQPLNEPNCGSVFTNPPGDSAGRLVEAVGAKGLVRGGARISERHANFIVTQPGVRAADVVGLVRAVHARVLDETGVALVPEVRVAGSLAQPVDTPGHTPGDTATDTTDTADGVTPAHVVTSGGAWWR